MQLVASREADAVIAAGSTGAPSWPPATMFAQAPAGRAPPGHRGAPCPRSTSQGVALLLDAGANPACRPHHLAQYAVMGANYYASAWGVETPRVGLVSIGEEEAKGNDFTQASPRPPSATTDVNFIGNVESRGLFGGDCEVAVADGFVGNIILKTAEGVAELLLGRVKSVIGSSHPKSFMNIAKSFDYASFGGAPLLGVDGTVVVCHGRSDRRAISNAILVAARAIAGHVNENIVAGLARQRES